MKQFLNTFSIVFIATFVMMFFLHIGETKGQLLVGDKNINEDQSIHYVQLIYYVEKKGFKPVYMIDYGLKNIDNVDLKPEIRLNGEAIGELTPVAILNKLYEAGWEYIGDYNYIQGAGLPTHAYTLKRRSEGK